MAEFYRLVRTSDNEGFLKKHKIWFTFLGTIVVTGTFVVNEALKGEARDLADTVDRAESASLLRSEIQYVESQIEASTSRIIRFGLSRGRRPVSPADNFGEDQEGIDMAAAQVDYPRLERRELVLENCLDLYERLPYDRALDDEHWGMISYFQAIKTWDTDYGELYSYFRDHDMKSSRALELKAALSEEGRFVARDVARFGTIDDAITKFNRALLLRARQIRSESEEKAKLWKHVSFALYPLGVVLGLLGKLAGGEENGLDEAG